MSSWHDLQAVDQLEDIFKNSFERPQLIFKHSISCGISAQIQHQLMSSSDELGQIADLHYLDLIRYRPASNQVANKFGIPHQSPQVLLIKEGEVVHHSSHFSIRPANIIAAAA